MGALREMARQKKILISIPDSLLDEADNMAYSQNVNRSEFIREAIKNYIREKKRKEIAESHEEPVEPPADCRYRFLYRHHILCICMPKI